MIRAALAFAALVAFAGGTSADPAAPIASDIPHFVNEAASAGVERAYTGPWEFFVGGGVAAFDCDGDRRPDLFLAGGTSPATLYRNRSATGGPLSFEAVDLGLAEEDRTRVLGAYPLDIDNDGYMDLAVLRLGSNLLLKGGPDCRFEVANHAFAFDGGKDWTTAFAATWEANQRFPTLAFGNYVDRHAPGAPWGTCADNLLLRPAPADGPVYDDPIRLTPGYCTLSMLFTDWNQSGTPSLRVTNDRQYYRGGEEQMWHVDPGKLPRLYTAAEGWRHLSIWGMGIAEADLNGDGYPEYALTSMGDTKLQQLDNEDGGEDRPVYRDIAFDRGATAQRPYAGGDRRPSTGWHSEFADVNNDGLLDLFIAKGNVEAMPDFAAYDPDNLLLGSWDGTFAEAGDKAGIAMPLRGRGGALVDLNMDGMLDLVVANRDGPTSLFRNLGMATEWGTAPLGNWLEIELFQPGPNRNAVGAHISVKTGTHVMTRAVEVGGGHASGHSGFIHVGLGTAERAEIRVRWPDGEWSHSYRVFANSFVRLERGKAAAELWLPEPPPF
ncbi:MAG: CRTAC1 family protein [Bauldia sp.]|nr:CRTAC1 family protein [Bauldia sp.]